MPKKCLTKLSLQRTIKVRSMVEWRLILKPGMVATPAVLELMDAERWG